MDQSFLVMYTENSLYPSALLWFYNYSAIFQTQWQWHMWLTGEQVSYPSLTLSAELNWDLLLHQSDDHANESQFIYILLVVMLKFEWNRVQCPFKWMNPCAFHSSVESIAMTLDQNFNIHQWGGHIYGKNSLSYKGIVWISNVPG